MRTRKLCMMLALCLPLTGCFDPNRAVLAEALGAVDIKKDTDSLALKGVPLGDGTGLGLTEEQGRALFNTHQNKPAHFLGTLEKVDVRGNTALIEVYPTQISRANRNCNLAQGNTVSNGCHVQNRSFVSTTCIVNDWATLDRQTGGDILESLEARKKDRKSNRGWPFLQLEGTLKDFKPTTKTILVYKNHSGFGVTSGFEGRTATYKTFMVNNCNVRGYRFKLVG